MRNHLIINIENCNFPIILVASLKHEYDDQIETIIIFISLLIMMATLTSNFYAKTLAILLYVLVSCFYYNMLLFHNPSNLSIMVTQIIVGFTALDANINDYVTN